MQGSPAENLTAVHLCFSNFMHGSPAENLVAVHLGFSNFMHGCRAYRHGINNKTPEHGVLLLINSNGAFIVNFE